MRWIFLYFILYLAATANAQFVLNGDATQVSDICFELTPDDFWRGGSIWNEEKINLNESFSMTINAFLGCKDVAGADGLYFAFQPINTSQGDVGGGIGYEGISPSIGIEVDTWQNGSVIDPPEDHIAIMRNGSINHASADNLAGPIQASPNSPNIEDCEYHQFRVVWDVPTLTLFVYFDCELRLTYTGDLVNEVFNGDPEVFWGFTSATGGARNKHEVCLTEIKFVEPIEDITICPGGQTQLEATGGDSYLWLPPFGLSDNTIANPLVSPDTTTTYIIEISNNNCELKQYDTLTVFVTGPEADLDLGPDVAICENDGSVLDATVQSSFPTDYLWSTGSTSATLTPTFAGNYSVTVTINDGCVTEDNINVDFKLLPNAGANIDSTLCLEQVLEVNAADALATSYLWNDGVSTPRRTLTETGSYYVDISNDCGSVRQNITIAIEDCTNVYAPNVFSPNNDGINDIFMILDEGDVDQITAFRIFNRWGGMVYEATNIQPNVPRDGWNGTFNNEPAEIGIYAWYADIVFRNGEKARMRGDVMLLR